MTDREPTLWSPGGDEPPDWALPSWDSLPDEGAASAPRTARPMAPPAGASPSVASPSVANRPAPALLPDDLRPTILGVSEVTRAVREAVRADDRLRDVWV